VFSKDNIKSIRFSNPQNDTIEVTYWDDENDENPLVKYWFPVIPYNSAEWKVVREAGYDLDSIYTNTLKWIQQIREYQEQQEQNQIKVYKNNFKKLQHSEKSTEKLITVTLHDVDSSDEDLNLFVTKHNNPNALIKTLNIPNSKESFSFDVDTDEKISVYLIT